MNVLRSNYVFPSYSKLKQQILDRKAKTYQSTINKLTSKLTNINKENNFEEDHLKIKNCIISLSSQAINQKPQIQKQTLTWAQPRYQPCSNQQSLNYYIEDDKQEENNYQTYLKFKKKALERDLQQDRYQKLSGRQKKKQQKEQEQLFKDLYQNQKSHIEHTQKSKISKKFEYKHFKTKAKEFQKKIERASTAVKRNKNNKSYVIHNQREWVEEEKHLVNYRQKMMYEKNKKFLTENYMEILKKLDNSNMVKWRILNTPQIIH